MFVHVQNVYTTLGTHTHFNDNETRSTDIIIIYYGLHVKTRLAFANNNNNRMSIEVIHFGFIDPTE